MPAGYRVEYGGQFESQQSATRAAARSSAAPSIAGLFMMLVLAFGRARDALLVMVNLPLALIGGVAGVFLAGGVLSVASMIGFITLFGIATRNGIMLVSHIQPPDGGRRRDRLPRGRRTRRPRAAACRS